MLHKAVSVLDSLGCMLDKDRICWTKLNVSWLDDPTSSNIQPAGCMLDDVVSTLNDVVCMLDDVGCILYDVVCMLEDVISILNVVR